MFEFVKKKKKNGGMTYVELIVVLSIFGIMSSIVMFNYNDFQAKVDIKNLANDIALEIVKAQKSAMGGKLPPQAQVQYLLANNPDWKPSYGVYFDTSSSGQKSFDYFVDLDGDKALNDFSCSGNNECLAKIDITKGNFVSKIEAVPFAHIDRLSIIFTRPDSGAVFTKYESENTVLSSSSVQIIISSKDGSAKAKINVYSSGRIQIN